jgi:hypothetical protein
MRTLTTVRRAAMKRARSFMVVVGLGLRRMCCCRRCALFRVCVESVACETGMAAEAMEHIVMTSADHESCP